MGDVRPLVVFKRHPDRMPGTWWALREKSGTLPRIACPTCGSLIFIRTSIHRVKNDGTVNASVICPKEACWVGRVKLDQWEA